MASSIIVGCILLALLCVTSARREIQTYRQAICEDSSVNICCPSNICCPDDTRIQISSMAYGRQPGSAGLCPGTNTDTADCVQFNNVISYVSHCNGQECCTIAATNDGLGGDPCVGTYKYAIVTCSPVPNPIFCHFGRSKQRLGISWRAFKNNNNRLN